VPLSLSSRVSGSKIFTITLSRGTPTHPNRRLSQVLLPVETTGAVGRERGGREGRKERREEREGRKSGERADGRRKEGRERGVRKRVGLALGEEVRVCVCV
jgi:hypothetical protein